MPIKNYTKSQFDELPEWARKHILALEDRCNVATRIIKSVIRIISEPWKGPVYGPNPPTYNRICDKHMRKEIIDILNKMPVATLQQGRTGSAMTPNRKDTNR